jgi:hypothetical protein
MRKTTAARIEPVPVPMSVQLAGVSGQPDLSELIAARAYELYQQRGAIDGYDVDDWLQAEREVSEQVESAA